MFLQVAGYDRPGTWSDPQASHIAGGKVQLCVDEFT
jgi:hypothetical protein